MQQKILACDVKLKRTYGPPSARDGTRILIDRLWPRGVKRANAVIDRWIKAIVPSTPLRKWLRHKSCTLQGFRRRHAAAIHDQVDSLGELRAVARRPDHVGIRRA
jgi:uncharacterized protein YeaO (DUF488 family)